MALASEAFSVDPIDQSYDLDPTIATPKHQFAIAQWEESFFPKTSVAIVILFWLKWAGYLAMAGLNLLAQLSDRRSPSGV